MRVLLIRHYQFLLVIIMLLTARCQKMSELEVQRSAGLNGGFEISKNGLPVNWLLYTPNTVPDAEFNIVLDSVNFMEGKQSLKFEVQKCNPSGGWHSPGFTNEFFEAGKYEGQASYKLSFWIKNDGARYTISAGSVAPYEGEMSSVIESNEIVDEWSYHEFLIEVQESQWLRMELNILSPGTFWIDDVKIEKA